VADETLDASSVNQALARIRIVMASASGRAIRPVMMVESRHYRAEYEAVMAEWNRGRGSSSVKKNEDFLFFSVDLIRIAGFMLNQRKNGRSSSP
jgi:hypothetical protein